MREATWIECYKCLRQNGLDIIGSVFYGTVLYMRKVKIEIGE